ncbi:aminopeptidase N [Actinomyces howellii]|uniref:Aminopeptidase N n=1 Tax=Actinomyces howellii TaxID=52771 RepID=A0A3S4SLK6_9ACTO|nr:aminopeptidase N [Actinomyces howellii]VEG26168.1 Aminopeptidase N [Actinomyces howellii]
MGLTAVPLSHAPARASGRGNIGREEAAWRSGVLRLEALEVVVDLCDTRSPGCSVFDVRSTLTLVVEEPGAAGLWVDFVGEHVRETAVDGVIVPVAWDGARLALPELAPGRHTVDVGARGRLSNSGQGLNRFVDPVDSATYLYTHFEPSDARRAWPCLDQPDLKAPFTLTVLHPASWTVLANGVVESTRPADHREGCTVTRMSTTPPLPSYLTALAAGPWHRVTSSWSSPLRPEDPAVELSWSCRASVARHLDDEPMAITAAGLDLFDRVYGFPYPWGSYDSVLVPEYNLGAMENPGCVTFNEDTYLLSDRATRAQRAERAGTILHEMCHMWFGDLVTPRWWEDTWLKESFAEHQGVWAQAEATAYTEAWVSFASRRKAWAYREDARPSTTHPIVAQVDDVEAARQAFDGITYAKGAAVLKQLVAHLGQEVFLTAARRWFTEHAYGNADLTDFIGTLSEASGRDMSSWAQAWLSTCGPSVISDEMTTAEGLLTSLVLTQEGLDPRTGEQVLRPHSLVVGLYSFEGPGGELVRTHRLPVSLTGPRAEVPGAAGLPVPDLVTVNDEDHTYAVVRPDPASLATARRALHRLTDPLTRSLWWSCLDTLVRDAIMAPGDFVETVLERATDSSETATLTTVLDQALTAAVRLSEGQERARLLGDLTGTRGPEGQGAWGLLMAAAPGSDAQLVRARAWIRAAGEGLVLDPAARASCASRLRLLADGGLEGLVADNDLRWRVLAALACLGEVTDAELDDQRRTDPSSTGAVRHLRAVSSLPSADLKAEVLERLLTDATLSKDQVAALVVGFAVDSHRELTAGSTGTYLGALEELWASRPQESATRLAVGLFPAAGEAGDLAAVETWLADHPHAPAALRRLVLKGRDDLVQVLRVRAAAH